MSKWQGYAILVAAILVVLLINPVGYTGGSHDNARYLDAARCWREQGFCLPRNHWEGRWPAFAPIAFFTQLFGEARWSVQLWPFLTAIAAALLMANIVERVTDRRSAIAATIFLIFTPVFGSRILTPAADMTELCLLLGSIMFVLEWRERKQAAFAFAAGLMFGLAFQVRETSLILVALTGLTLLATGSRPRLIDIAAALAGFLLPLLIEFSVFQIAADDFLFRRRLSLMHGQISSSELAASVDTSRSPLLNPEFIAGWRKSAGIELHWLVDGPLNLLVNAGAGFSLLLAPILLVFGGKTVPVRMRRLCWILLGLATAYIATIIYVLGMDPKPRSMLPALATSSVALAVVSLALFDIGKRQLVIVTWISAILANAFIISTGWRPAWAERQAKLWLERYPDKIEADHMTRSLLTLLPNVHGMPGVGAGRDYVMVFTHTDCKLWALSDPLPMLSLKVEDGRRLSIMPSRPGKEAWLCLFRYEPPIAPGMVTEKIDAIWRSRAND